MQQSAVVIHVPHSSTCIPSEYRAGILLGEKALFRELCRVTDAFCDELFEYNGFAPPVVFPVSRLVCDVERFRSDEQEPMAKKGKGLFYTRTMLGGRLRLENESQREQVLSALYDPHHARLTQAVGGALLLNGACLIIDGHSFNSYLPVRASCLFSMPDFCIGTDSFHTPPGVTEALVNTVRTAGFTVRVNDPYGGSITPIKHYRRDARVKSVMIEVNRRLYMDEARLIKSACFAQIRAFCGKLMEAAAAACP